jgi:hypothetical protein
MLLVLKCLAYSNLHEWHLPVSEVKRNTFILITCVYSTNLLHRNLFLPDNFQLLPSVATPRVCVGVGERSGECRTVIRQAS